MKNKTRPSTIAFKFWQPSISPVSIDSKENGIPPFLRSVAAPPVFGPLTISVDTLIASLPQKIKIGVVNVSVAGCKIELFDKDNYQTVASKAPSWMSNIIKTYDGNPYQHLVEMGKLAQQDGVIKGILLHQGESNTGDEKWPGKVKGVYDNPLHKLNLKPDQVPLLAGEVVNADQEGACAAMNSNIARLPNTIPTAHVISSAGCQCKSDHLHFTRLVTVSSESAMARRCFRF